MTMRRRYSASRTPQSSIALLITLAVTAATGGTLAQDDPFAAGVRPTPWLSPEEEQKLFKLPEGFEIQLVAAEPDIQKPLNMAFDEKGRIWLTCTVEYPYAAPLDKPGRDSIRVLEDTDGDGRFEKVSIFADGLNIPIGIYPWKGGCVAYSIPNITHFEDTDGDGKCDQRTKLYGPFDHTRDTHGMVNSFRRGFDGWVYACHGFNNDSHVKGADGHEVHMQSGNTFRFQLDGSRIEHFTHGQVNPFGMCFDELFNIFTADCHSKPLTQLIRGGYYPSFGKPHDGLGFVPPMMDHLHGSTAICGLAIYTGENFPQEYRGDFFSGNVMTSRINRNKPEYHGSTIKAIEQPDFLIAGDPWFRPVDIQIGPDGAMYVLDFYNRIIGHYEVPLPHPGRDRTSGRIWRIVYKGSDPETRPAEISDRLSRPGEVDFVSELLHPQLERRLRALNLLVDHQDRREIDSILTEFEVVPKLEARIAEAWIRHRSGVHPSGKIATLANASADVVSVHALKILSERTVWSEGETQFVLSSLRSRNAFVARAAAETLALQAKQDAFASLIYLLRGSDPSDNHLQYVVSQALRNRLALADRQAAWVMFSKNIERQPLTAQEKEVLVQSGLGAKSEGACEFLIYLLGRVQLGEQWEPPIARHIARYGWIRDYSELKGRPFISPNDWDQLQWLYMSTLRPGQTRSQVQELALFQACFEGYSQRDPRDPARALLERELVARGEKLTNQLLATESGHTIPWTAVPIDGLPPSENPWVLQQRASQDGDKESMFFCSIVKGEQRTGIYRSAAFELPAKLSFWCAGHDGFPNVKLQGKNLVRLRDAKTHEVIASSPPPRNDTAQRIEWEVSKHAGKQGYVELIDGDTAGAYAWLAVGRFSIEGLNPSKRTEHLIAAADIVGKLKLQSLRPKLLELFGSRIDPAARVAIGQALVALQPDTRAAALVAAMADPSFPAELTPRTVYAINVDADGEYLDNLKEVMKRAPTRLQTSLAETLAGDAAGAETLVALVKAGVASPRLLISANVKAKLDAIEYDALHQQIMSITANLPGQNEIIDKLVLERRAAYPKAKPSLENGAALFEKHCAACHQIAGKGSVIGPQLDGIGLRGLERLMEDVLDPNRNVDVAFRTTTIRTVDGEVISGLVRREEGATLILADNKGQEIAVPKSDIDEQAKGSLSLMPANVHEIVSASEFYDLLAYLLSQKQAKEPAN